MAITFKKSNMFKKPDLKARKKVSENIAAYFDKQTTCTHCKGDGDYEQSAGTHSFFVECSYCSGSGKTKLKVTR